jgi:hypothetical protein
MNRSAGSQSASSTRLQQVVRQRPLFCFFLMVYACSWIVWIPYVLSVWSIIPVNTFTSLTFSIGTFLGPTLAAFVVTGSTA